MPEPLPIDEILPEITGVLLREGNIVLQAPPGAGKTTRVPPALLAAGLAQAGQILVLEPRRLAAQTAARRMAFEAGEPVGQTFGFHIRFERRASAQTRVLVVTEGVLLRMLMDDPLLEKVAVVVFDEFHERNLNSDLALAILRRLQVALRPELKLVVMSATLDPTAVVTYLQCPVVQSAGKRFPVDIRYRSLPSQAPLPRLATEGVLSVVTESAGHTLVFLPGVGEIRRTRQELVRHLSEQAFLVCELYGDLPMDAQESVLRPATHRKVILSTNVAETSITIDGVTAVVDTGLARILRCDPSIGINRLAVERISRASADQRAGRAGRTAPGVCLRLWTEAEHRFLAERETPEILRLDLAGPLLTLLGWGESDWETFPWFEPPPAAAWQSAEKLLEQLGATRERQLTPLGRSLAALPLHPRMARLLVEGCEMGCAERAAWAAALLTERDPFQSDPRKVPAHVTSSDLLDRVHALEAYRDSGHLDSVVGRLNSWTADHIARVHTQLLRQARDAGLRTANTSSTDDRAFLESVLAAFPDRVSRRRELHSPRAVMVGGRGVRLDRRSAVTEGELFVGVDLEEVGAAESLVRQASLVDPRWLPPHLMRETTSVEFDAERERVKCVRRTLYVDLILDERQADTADAQTITNVLAAAAAEQLDRALPLQEPAVRDFLARVRSLRIWSPQLHLPDFTPEELQELLPQLCAGKRSFAELRGAPLVDYLRASLTREQQVALDRDAPERVAAASGNRIRLAYEPGRSPVMAVRIQEMFGQVETPRVAGGRVPVLLHLLGPNMRTQQVTDDLRGFWERTYPLIRKELRRRYPKHAWPENPLADRS